MDDDGVDDKLQLLLVFDKCREEEEVDNKLLLEFVLSASCCCCCKWNFCCCCNILLEHDDAATGTDTANGGDGETRFEAVAPPIVVKYANDDEELEPKLLPLLVGIWLFWKGATAPKLHVVAVNVAAIDIGRACAEHSDEEDDDVDTDNDDGDDEKGDVNDADDDDDDADDEDDDDADDNDAFDESDEFDDNDDEEESAVGDLGLLLRENSFVITLGFDFWWCCVNIAAVCWLPLEHGSCCCRW